MLLWLLYWNISFLSSGQVYERDLISSQMKKYPNTFQVRQAASKTTSCVNSCLYPVEIVIDARQYQQLSLTVENLRLTVNSLF